MEINKKRIGLILSILIILNILIFPNNIVKADQTTTQAPINVKPTPKPTPVPIFKPNGDVDQLKGKKPAFSFPLGSVTYKKKLTPKELLKKIEPVAKFDPKMNPKKLSVGKQNSIKGIVTRVHILVQPKTKLRVWELVMAIEGEDGDINFVSIYMSNEYMDNFNKTFLKSDIFNKLTAYLLDSGNHDSFFPFDYTFYKFHKNLCSISIRAYEIPELRFSDGTKFPVNKKYFYLPDNAKK